MAMTQKKQQAEFDLGTGPSQGHLSAKERKNLLKKQKASND